jgi:mono/diheme cytochrome c family protein
MPIALLTRGVVTSALSLLVTAAAVGGCKGGAMPASNSVQPPGGTAPPPAGAEPAAHLSATNVVPYDTTGEPALDPATITPSMIAQGRRIYAGRGSGGASCFSCHGLNAEGTKSGPRLAHADWIDADGSYGSIVRVIVNGVPHPRAFSNPMPQLGAAVLSYDQVKAVAAYVYSLNRSKPRAVAH